MIEVIATKMGYFDNRRMKPGAVFLIKSEKQFSSKWMKKVEEEKPKELAKNKSRLGSLVKQDEDVI